LACSVSAFWADALQAIQLMCWSGPCLVLRTAALSISTVSVVSSRPCGFEFLGAPGNGAAVDSGRFAGIGDVAGDGGLPMKTPRSRHKTETGIATIARQVRTLITCCSSPNASRAKTLDRLNRRGVAHSPPAQAHRAGSPQETSFESSSAPPLVVRVSVRVACGGRFSCVTNH